MSSMHVAFGTAIGAGAPTYPRNVRSAEVVTTGASAASSTIEANGGDYAFVSAVDAGLYVRIGADAAAGLDHYVAPGTTKDIGPLKEGDTVSGIEA